MRSITVCLFSAARESHSPRSPLIQPRLCQRVAPRNSKASEFLGIALESKIADLKSQIEPTPWCNGNTAPFGGVILGSNPSGVAT